jgi:hypothetical protein
MSCSTDSAIQYVMVDPEIRTSHDGCCYYELSLHNKKTNIIQNMTENIVAYFYFYQRTVV